jgi:hypothetical protein
MINTFLGIGNSVDPKLIFISFDPCGEWPWDFIDNLNGMNKSLQDKFFPLIDFAFSLRSNRFLTRLEADIECPYWTRSITNRIELELNIIQGFMNKSDFNESYYFVNQDYYINEYRKHELSFSFYPIAPGYKKSFSNLLTKYLSLPDTPKEYYDSRYNQRVHLFSLFYKTILNKSFQPISFVLLPNDERKKFYMLKWIEEMKLFEDPLDFSCRAISNHDCSFWIIPNADSIDINFDELQKTILEKFFQLNPSLLIKLKGYYNNTLGQP